MLNINVKNKELTCNRIMPELKGGGLHFKSPMARFSLSMAIAGDGTAPSVRVSMVPIGTLG